MTEKAFTPLRVGPVERAGVDVRTSFDASVEAIVALEPERVIVATGSRPVVPPITGLDHALTAEQVITGVQTPGQRVLVLGGGMVGTEMAELLAGQGRQVVVVELLEDIARDMEAVTRKMTLRRLQNLLVTIHASTRLTRVVEGEAFVVATESDEERSLGTFDSILVAVGHRSYDPLSAGLERAGLPVTVVGDAARPGQILDATRSGLAAVVQASEW